MRFSKECVCNLKKSGALDGFVNNEKPIPDLPDQPRGLVEAASLRCDRILSKIFSPARLGSGVDAAVVSPPPSAVVVGVENRKSQHPQQCAISGDQVGKRIKRAGKSRSPTTSRSRRSPKRRHSSQDGASENPLIISASVFFNQAVPLNSNPPLFVRQGHEKNLPFFYYGG